MTDRFVPVAPMWWVSNFGGVVLTGVTAARTKRPFMRAIFVGAVALHVGEAVYAYRSARAAGFTRSAPKWALQTLGVGFPSLRALHDARESALDEAVAQ
jgi:hypothetical protein